MENGKILPVFIEDEMQKSYLDYSMSMITARALPDVRDGLKPVHRRVLYGMHELGLVHNRAPKKCARVVGDVIGKYHPHGDMPVYDALVRLAQDFSLRYRMVEGQGNFGSIDGDPPAAMRYTECRMTEMAEEMLSDIDKETVGFGPNYDDSTTEPKVLPAKVPFLLVNGSTGIAVGMATNMAPHNLGEVIDAIIATIDNPAIDLPGLLAIMPGPDFPTGAVIYGRAGIVEAYKTGKGKIIIRARASVEKEGEREQIVFTEIPFMLNKSALLEKMGELVREKVIEGISFLRDESDRSGLRIVVGIKKDSFSEIILNQLYKFTPLQSTFGIINLALVDMRPRLLSLRELLDLFVKHRFDVVTRRAEFELKKARDRAHILEGLRIAIDHIDEIVALIKAAPSPDEAHNRLKARFSFSDAQAQAILEMRLQRLTGLERDKIEAEYRELQALIARLAELLASPEKRMRLIKDELADIKQRFGDKRKTEIIDAEGDVEIEDMIADEDMVITMSHTGYVKRCAVDTYRSQGRGGRGVKGMDSKEDDFVSALFIASAHSSILFFTTAGRCYCIKVYRIPEAPRQARGRPIINVLELRPEEKIAAFVPVKDFERFAFTIIATKCGVINKQPLSAYANIRKDGINAINLDENDQVIECKLTSGDDDIILATREGQAVRFHESATRELGRNTRGMKGITVRGNDEVIGMIVARASDVVLSVTGRGFGKKTPVADYRKTNRGGSGIINFKCTDKTGMVIGIKGVKSDADLLLITRNGIIIRSDVNKIPIIGRNTQGVKLITLDEGDEVIDVALCRKEEQELNGDTQSVGAPAPEGAIEAEPEQPSPHDAAAPADETPDAGDDPPPDTQR